MRHRILGIIIVCLTLAASVVTANVAVCEGIDEETSQNVIVEEYEEVMSTVDFDISEEELHHRTEQQRHHEELLQAFLADVGVTEEKLQQYVNKLGEKVQPYMEQFIKESFDVTPDNYVEKIDVLFDNFLVPLVNDFRAESFNFFSEEQYAKLMTWLCQLSELGGLNLFGDQSAKLFGDIINDLWICSDAVGLTEEQSKSLVQVQKDFVAELLVMNFTMEKEIELLVKQLLEAQTDEERVDVEERFRKLYEKIPYIQDKFNPSVIRTKLDTLLTAEQKEKLAQIKQGLPDYLKDALAKMTQTRTDDNAETHAAWRPGINSWIPGQGVPTDLENYPREAPRVREPRGERRFPGSE